MKVYVAAPFAARALGCEVAATLVDADFEVTSRWLLGSRDILDDTVGTAPASTEEEVLLHAEGDLANVEQADFLVMLSSAYVHQHEPNIPEAWLHTGGRHVEMGYALALGKPVHLLGEPENIFGRALATVHASMESLMEVLTRGE